MAMTAASPLFFTEVDGRPISWKADADEPTPQRGAWSAA